MQIFEQVKEMQVYAESIRNKGKTISFVPTMGYFHEGHLNLMREGLKRSDCLVVSIYVNPTQFAPNEDLSAYPRNFDRDRQLVEALGADVIFYPSNNQMYPEGYQTFVNVEDLTQNLCGLSRPAHFRGVTTICAKLFNIVKPHITIFGKKDFQQLMAIKKMVADLNMNIEVVGMPITREIDGLAMSSRNIYLNHEERQSALSLSRSLKIAHDMYVAGERSAGIIITKIKNFIAKHQHTQIDYVQICETKNMRDVDKIDDECVVALAVRVGKARLIDNLVFGEKINIP